MDVEGTILVRDLRQQDVISTINLGRSYDSGTLMFNPKMKNELLVFYNNDLELYDATDGRMI